MSVFKLSELSLSLWFSSFTWTQLLWFSRCSNKTKAILLFDFYRKETPLQIKDNWNNTIWFLGFFDQLNFFWAQIIKKPPPEWAWLQNLLIVIHMVRLSLFWVSQNLKSPLNLEELNWLKVERLWWKGAWLEWAHEAIKRRMRLNRWPFGLWDSHSRWVSNEFRNSCEFLLFMTL